VEPEALTEAAPTIRSLPTNPSEFEKAIGPYRIMVRPMVVPAQKVCKTLPPKDPLDGDERESLEMSYAAAMYQSGGDVDMRIAAAFATLGVAIPRIIKYLDDKEASEKKVAAIPTQVQNAQQQLVTLQNQLAELEKKKSALEVKPVPVINFPEQN
jgi:hypothetical protein